MVARMIAASASEIGRFGVVLITLQFREDERDVEGSKPTTPLLATDVACRYRYW